MAVRGQWRAGRLAAAVMVTAMLLVGLAPVPSRASAPERAEPLAMASTASAYRDGFRIQSKTTYVLDPPGEAVHVAYEATITNEKPDQVSAGFTRQFYLPDFPVPVLAEAVALQAVKSDGAVLPVDVEPSESPRFSFAVIDLIPDVYHPASQTFRFTYDLPRLAPRSDGFTRINDAYATFPLLAVGDPGITDVELVVPEGFEVELIGDQMEESERDGQQVFAATALEDPDAWDVLVSARDDSQLIERSVDVGDEDVKVLGWPDDPEWADFAATQVAEGVPALEELIGIDWPATSTIDVVETASPYLYGYAGWYMPVESLIEVGDELDQHVMLHELSHLWFNDDLFEGRWINEAFADQVSAMAVAELGSPQPAPERINPDDPGRLKLNDWSNPDLQSGISADQERYGYNASWAVMNAIADEIGAEALAEVIQAADEGQVAYRGPGFPEELARTFDWKELLDLLEEVGGSQEAAGHFQRHVVSDAETGDFVARATARQHYARLLADGRGWAAPTSIRLAMTDWRFEAAEELMAQASLVLLAKEDVVTAAADLDVDDHLALQDAYEGAKDLDNLAVEVDDALEAAEALGAAEDAEAEGAGPLGAIGLLFSGVDDLDEAQAAFEAGDYAAVVDKAAGVTRTMDRAPVTGVVRLVGLALLLTVALFVRRALRERQAHRPVAGFDGA